MNLRNYTEIYLGNMIYTNEICYCLHTGVADSYRVAVLRKQEGDNVYVR